MRSKDYYGYTIFENGDIVGKRGTYLTPQDNGKGYLIVNLQVPFGKVCKAVHRLLAESFIPNPENLSDVDHIDGNRQNNSLTNLRWVTHGENIAHSFALENRSATGEDNANNKFLLSVVIEICELLQKGFSAAEIRDFNYDYGLVRAIKSRRNWKSVSINYSW